MESIHSEPDGLPEVAPVVSFRVVCLLPHDGKEPSKDLTDREATASWVASTAPWHPALLALADELPRLEDLATPPDPQPGDLFLVASGGLATLSAEARSKAEAAGVAIVEGSEDRLETIRAMLAHSPSRVPWSTRATPSPATSSPWAPRSGGFAT